MINNYKLKFNEYLNTFNNFLNENIDNLSQTAPKIIVDAISYAVKDGGKRIRPVLCLATADVLGVPQQDVLNYALAIELIHSYSLVHDDLPAMDNDDYRRGKLSTHKKFGEAYGILAGDALLTLAFELCLNKREISKEEVSVIRTIASCAGYDGMIAGQVLDLQNERNDNADERVLYDIYANKTAKLIIAPILVASILLKNKHLDELTKFGLNLGFLFQITDDILDAQGDIETIGKTPHKDIASDKLTSIKLFGLDGAKERMNIHYDVCLDALSKIPNSDFLKSLTDEIYNRKK